MASAQERHLGHVITPTFSLDDDASHQTDTISQAASKHILELSRQMMLFYSKDPSGPKDISHLLAPEYSILLDCTQTDYDMQRYLDYCQDLSNLCPDLDIYVINATAQIVNYSRGVVYIPFMMNGLPGNISKKLTHVLKWRKKDGNWTCYGHLGFQGMNLPARVSERDDAEQTGKRRCWLDFPTTTFEESKVSFLSGLEVPPERGPMSRSEIDEILMKRFS